MASYRCKMKCHECGWSETVSLPDYKIQAYDRKTLSYPCPICKADMSIENIDNVG